MEDTAHRAIAIVGVGAVLPDAINARAFWENVKNGRYSIAEVAPSRWDPALYYDPDPSAPDKTYSKIGGWVRENIWDPLKWRLPIPPRVAGAMDDAQKWAVSCTKDALDDYGYPGRPLDLDRTAVILGNAMAGEKHYLTALRLYMPEIAHELSEVSQFASLPESVRRDVLRELEKRFKSNLPEVTEDTMPGELANCMAGRVANLFNLHGPNYVCDAACASAMAAISSAVEGLVERDFDVAITGGVDRNMSPHTFIKFCKIGALSATGTRPYAAGADGFVMGEGAALFILKRLADAERDHDAIYAVLRGIGGSSDGKGKGITAPNPVGQKFCLERAWINAGLSPATVTYVEGHGTSTRVGDVVEVQSLVDMLRAHNLPGNSIALGSVKSNIGHLKGAAGAAGLLKATFALRDKVLPPSVHCEHPNPDIDFVHSPLFVNTQLREWTNGHDYPRRAGVSAFGFGGTNFHMVLEEYQPGRLQTNGKHSVFVSAQPPVQTPSESSGSGGPSAKVPLRGALLLGAATVDALTKRLREVEQEAIKGRAPSPERPCESDLRASERIAIDYSDAAELADRTAKALKALAADNPAIWKALRAQGIFRGRGPAPKVAFLYTGQGSQYANMMRPLRDIDPIVRSTFEQADRVMTPILGRALTSYIFIDGSDENAVSKAENDLRQTEITQPAVLAADMALTRMLAAYGIQPDMTMGHSLGEYGALVAAGALPFEEALEAVSARGRGMARFAVADNGKMAAIFAPIAEIERILATIEGYVVIANINSNTQAVIGGASTAVERAVEVFLAAGYNAVPLEVSHAFHTSIVAPASEPLRGMLDRLHLEPPRIPVVTNVSGEFYPTGPEARTKMLDLLARQVFSPVQFVKGLNALYDAGVRVFVEVGPKKALQGFAEDVLGDRGDVLSLFTNHPKVGDVVSLNQALCGLYAWGLGGARAATSAVERASAAVKEPVFAPVKEQVPVPEVKPTVSQQHGEDKYSALGHLLADFLDRSWSLYQGREPASAPAPRKTAVEEVAVTGAALGLPGTERIFDDANIGRILRGEQLIRPIPARFRDAMVDKHITRLVKSENGDPVFESIQNADEVIRLAGRGGAFDPGKEFGIPADRLAALDRVTLLAIAVGLDALRDAGIPLVMHYKTTSKGTQLPERWGLPDALRDETGIIFASCWPGSDSLVQEVTKFQEDKARRERLRMLEDLRSRTNGRSETLDAAIESARRSIDAEPYTFDRRFLFRTLAMGHSQFAELIGARGPNTQVNAACASTTQAVALAEDWIREGRCRRVVVVSADDVTSDNLLEWVGSGFLATGAAATDEEVENAALPFDKRRHGTIIGMGAAGLVIESADAARERGLRPICQLLSAVAANSAFHGTRLDVAHICGVMEGLVRTAEERSGIPRQQMAERMVFISHETYTPARGGSAAAEIYALRTVFGSAADGIIIANTKGFTGHAMGAGIEDVVAVKALESGFVPPVANFREADPELGSLNLSKGGEYPVEFALRLGAGFGSQISMTLFRLDPRVTERPRPEALGYRTRMESASAWSSWLQQVTGLPEPQVEVVQHTLRVKDRHVTAPSVAVEPPKVVSAPAAPVTDAVKDRVLSLVAGKTGYPPDMLALDLDLEADLGVDTVKQAEIFASVREAYGIPRDETLRLRDFPTLAHVIRFVHERASVSPAPVPVVTTAASDDVQDRVITLVCEKTGYPRDMLALDLDLEADLGVDTVKQAELFAAVREIYSIPRDENLKLRDFPTLAHVIRFVKERRPVQTGVAAPFPPPATDDVTDKVLALVCEKTGYPREMLDLDLDLEADLGVDTVKQAELFAAVRGLYDIPRDENLKLRDFPTLAHVIRFVKERRPAQAGAAEPVVAAVPVTDDVTDKVLELVCEKTGYPREMLDLELDLEADLGVDTVKQAELFAAVRGLYNIPRDENLKLRDFPTLAHVIRFVHERRALLEQPPVPAVAPAFAAAPTPPATSEENTIQSIVLRIAAKHTGYPEEMLDLELDLEADLGIDTVKQAEMFASVRAAFDIPRDETLKLRDFPTLAHVISFARERQRAVTTPAPVDAASIEAADTVPRRVPVPVLRPPLSLCKPTSVTLGPGSRVLVAMDMCGVAEALTGKLRDIGVEVVGLDGEFSPDTIQGVYWLPALDDEEPIGEMSPASWREAIDRRVKRLYSTARSLRPDAFLVSGVRLGGQHGYGTEGATSPLGGCVTGFTKAYKRERPSATVKTVDFEAACDPSQVAETLLAETLQDPGAVEIGYKDGLRWTVALREQPVADGQPGLTLDKDSVFVVTGAAGSIVSAIVADLAAASGGTFYLLDLVGEPDPASEDLRRLNTDREGLKRDLAARIQQRGERATPALIEKELAAMERSVAALSAIEAIRAAGGSAIWCAVNLTDESAVAAVVDRIRQQHGRIDVLMHAAGLERSHMLPDKPPAEFDLVFDVKADGWFHLMRSTGDMPLRATVAFSSIAGRFGNGGQTDYSAANDLLCKLASNMRTTRPHTRALVLDWTAWAGIGMASRGSIPKMMEAAGIDMLAPEAGIRVVRRELTAGGSRGEIVIANRLGILTNEFDVSGGLNRTSGHSPMVGQMTGMTVHGGLQVETELDPRIQPFLNDHRIEGTPVLPGVMALEAFAETAACLLPEWKVNAIENVEFLAPFKFYRDEARTLLVEAVLRADGDEICADCRLSGARTLAVQTEQQVTTHFTGTVRLCRTSRDKETRDFVEGAELLVDAETIYKVYFHGPAYQVLDQVSYDGRDVIGVQAQNLPAGHVPTDQPMLIQPRLIELAFQTAGVWEIHNTGTLGLPHHIDAVAVWSDRRSGVGPFRAIMKPTEATDAFDVDVIDAEGSVCVRLTGYRTVALGTVSDQNLLQAFRAHAGA